MAPGGAARIRRRVRARAHRGRDARLGRCRHPRPRHPGARADGVRRAGRGGGRRPPLPARARWWLRWARGTTGATRWWRCARWRRGGATWRPCTSAGARRTGRCCTAGRWRRWMRTRAGRRSAAAAVVMDGLLGTGARGAPRDAHADAIRAIGAAGRPVVALDGPSGVDFTTGAVAGEAVRAGGDRHLRRAQAGAAPLPRPRARGADRGGGDGLPAAGGRRRRVPGDPRVGAAASCRRCRPTRTRGRWGRWSSWPGGRGWRARRRWRGGALRAGAGMAVLVSAAENRAILQTALPEALFVDRDAARRRPAGGAAALAAGPGMGTDDEALDLLRGSSAKATRRWCSTPTR
jgi:hypothetical protein